MSEGIRSTPTFRATIVTIGTTPRIAPAPCSTIITSRAGTITVQVGTTIIRGMTRAASAAAMILGETESISLASRLIARWDVSRFGVMPSLLSIICLPIYVATLSALHAVGGPVAKPAIVVTMAIQLVLPAFDLGRGVWMSMQPNVSARWLGAVHAAIGEDLFGQAFHHLVVCYGGDADYVIKRADMVRAVQVVKARERDDVRRKFGVQIQKILLHET